MSVEGFMIAGVLIAALAFCAGVVALIGRRD